MLLGFIADRILGDPRRLHPVAGFGQVAAAFERRTYADSVGAGTRHVALLVGGAVLTGILADLKRPGPLILTTAACTWAVLGGRSLVREGEVISAQLASDDLPAARVQLTHLVGRDTTRLDAAEVARAAVESLAENTSDAVVAPLCWGALGGPAGLLGYRAVNTLDAMIGHRSPRYLQFGRVAARLDDVANWVPARISVLLTAAAARTVGGSALAAIRMAVRDGPRHPSPNAGPVEAAFAGALGIRLGGVNSYHGQLEDRGQLGDGRPPEVPDLARAVRLSTVVGAGAALLCAAGAAIGRAAPRASRAPVKPHARSVKFGARSSRVASG